MSKKLYILCQRYYDEDKRNISIGGIQTYILNLLDVAKYVGVSVSIIQYAKSNFILDYADGIRIIGVDVSKTKSVSIKNRRLYKVFLEYATIEDVLLYATEAIALQKSKCYSIAIQHGISWDIESQEQCSRFSNICNIFRKSLEAILLTYYIKNVDKVIAVDYNYLNWYRTQIKHKEAEIKVIPNFTKIPAKNKKIKIDESVTILFARRLQPYRGTRLFAEAIRNILIKYDNLNVVIAGEGPDEEYLKAMFADNAHVTFIKYHVSESLEIHKDVDIAVIPTVGSEGTSFSLLEAMASYCAVICTNVGGMTNIIINGYNGIMINPSVKELTNALDLLVSDEATRLYLANNAYDVAKKSFSYDRWKDSWISILQNAFNI